MKSYILSIIAVAIICAIVASLLSQKSTAGKVVRLLCGILMTLTVVAPLGNISFHSVTDYFDDLSLDANAYVADGKNAAQENFKAIIKSQTESYILDKAQSMDLDIAVEVEVDGNNDSLPSGVTISGTLSPYAKKVMSTYIQQELGIAMENQRWT